MTPEVAVIINSFNRLILLKECLPNILSVLQAAKIPGVIIVLDAGSTDGSVEYVREMMYKEPSIVLMDKKLEDKISFSAGCNEAVKEALQRRPAISGILFFETDNLFRKETPLLQALELMRENKKLASVGFTVEKISGEKIVYGNSKPSVLGFVLGQQLASRLGVEQVTPKWIKDQKNAEYTITDIVFTSPLLVRTRAWVEVGGMDSENFPFSDSDTDLCLKFLDRNYKNVVIKCEGVVHDNRNNASSWSSHRVYNYHHARYALLTKHKPWAKALLKILLPVRHAVELLTGKLLGKSPEYLNNRKRLLSSVWNGYQ